MTYPEEEEQGGGWSSTVISPLLSDSGFKNLQEELASMSKVVLETKAIDISMSVYELQEAILVPLTPVYSKIVQFLSCHLALQNFASSKRNK